MNALTIDLVPGGKIDFVQSETGIEILYKETERHKEKCLGAIKTGSLLFLNTFFSSCITIAMEKSKPPVPDFQQFLPILQKMVDAMGKEGFPPPLPIQEVD